MSKKQSSETRNQLRDLTLGAPRNFRRKEFNYYPPIFEKIEHEDGTVEHDFIGFEDKPIVVEFRQPTVRERNDMIKACSDESGILDQMSFIINAVIRLTYDPESGERLYDKADYDALCNQPTGSFVDQFGEVAIQMLSLGQPNSGEDTKKLGNETSGTSSSRKTDTSKPSSQ